VDLRLIARNPAASADPPKVRHEEITPLNMDQTRVFLDAARGQKHEALYVLSLTCALRMGESLGLRWSDIDLEAGTLQVNRQLQRIREGGGLVFSEPKNASRRTIDLPQRALERLSLQLGRGSVAAVLEEAPGIVSRHGVERPAHRFQ
jgi:integrase